MNDIILNAPAKVNLYLRVLERRPDGYHKILTLFEKISLFDRIMLKKATSGISVHSDDKSLPEGPENLAYRAVRLLQKRTNVHFGVTIEIEKKIPIGAGLGGGSSDAAAVLVGINRLYDLGRSIEELEMWAAELGADVPFFLSDKRYALGRERGDKIESVESDLRMWHILIIPSFSVFSRDAYEWIDKKAQQERPEADELLLALEENDIERLGRNLHNDLEEASLEKDAALRSFKKALMEYGARGSMITGSGPALFGIAKDKEEVMNLKERVEDEVQMIDKNWRVLVASTYD